MSFLVKQISFHRNVKSSLDKSNEDFNLLFSIR